jgi:hypothetical protein
VAVHLTMPLSAGAGRLRRLHRWRLAPLPAGSARRPGSVPDPSLSLSLSLYGLICRRLPNADLFVLSSAGSCS